MLTALALLLTIFALLMILLARKVIGASAEIFLAMLGGGKLATFAIKALPIVGGLVIIAGVWTAWAYLN